MELLWGIRVRIRVRARARMRMIIRIRVRVRVRERHGTDPSIDASGASGRTELYYPSYDRAGSIVSQTKRKGGKGKGDDIQ